MFTGRLLSRIADSLFLMPPALGAVAMAILSHLNSCSSVWKKRAHKELGGGPQACPQPVYSSGVRCLVTTGVWEVGVLPASGRSCSGKTPTPSQAFRNGGLPARILKQHPIPAVLKQSMHLNLPQALLMPPEVFEPVAPGWRQHFAMLWSLRSSWYSAWSLYCQKPL